MIKSICLRKIQPICLHLAIFIIFYLFVRLQNLISLCIVFWYCLWRWPQHVNFLMRIRFLSFRSTTETGYFLERFGSGCLFVGVFLCYGIANSTSRKATDFFTFTHFVTCLRKYERNFWQLVRIPILRVLFEMRHQFLTVILSMWKN